jgi:Do/DeqQ family serine protease
MKTTLVFVLTIALGISLLTLNAQPRKSGDAAAPRRTELPKLDVRIDPSPVGEGQAPALTSYADVLSGVRPAVVSVYSSRIVRQRVPEFYRQLFGPNLPDREQRLSGMGSGVIISSDGYILTNNHVIEEADELRVALTDEREFTAKLVGTDPKTDIAVIKIDATDLPTATLADSDKLRVGDVVFAIGNPLAIGQTVTMGIVSATGRRANLLTDRVSDAYEDFIQTDAAINIGNSGGALVDARGRLVGINSGIATTNRGNIGIGFAVPINLARSVTTSLIEHGLVLRGYLGVASETLTGDVAESFGLPRATRGVIVTELSPSDGPAAKAGIKREDVITGINGRSISTREELRILIAQILPGTKVSVEILRDGKPRTMEVMLGKLEDAFANGEFLTGVSVQTLTAELRRDLRIDPRVEGIVVSDVTRGSPYAAIFPVGTVIEQINRVPVNDLASARAALRSGRNMAFVYQNGTYRYIVFDTR